MDQKQHLWKAGDDSVLIHNFDRAWDLVVHMEERLRMAHFWCTDLLTYWEMLKGAYRSYRRYAGSPSSNGSGSTSESKVNGLDAWLNVEHSLKDFGDHQNNEDRELSKNVKKPDMTIPEGSDGESPAAVKSEEGDAQEHTPHSDAPFHGFTSVNGNNHAARTDDANTRTPDRYAPNYAQDTYTSESKHYGYNPYPANTNESHHMTGTSQSAESRDRARCDPHDPSYGLVQQPLPFDAHNPEQMLHYVANADHNNTFYLLSLAAANEDAADPTNQPMAYWPMPPYNGQMYEGGNYGQ